MHLATNSVIKEGIRLPHLTQNECNWCKWGLKGNEMAMWHKSKLHNRLDIWALCTVPGWSISWVLLLLHSWPCSLFEELGRDIDRSVCVWVIGGKVIMVGLVRSPLSIYSFLACIVRITLELKILEKYAQKHDLFPLAFNALISSNLLNVELAHFRRVIVSLMYTCEIRSFYSQFWIGEKKSDIMYCAHASNVCIYK